MTRRGAFEGALEKSAPRANRARQLAEFDDILRCTLGTAAFQLDDYGLKVSPTVEQGKGQTGATVEVTGQGYVQGVDADDFAAKLAAVQAASQQPGQDFTVHGLGGAVEAQVLAARCLDGGPHVGFEMQPQGDGSALVKRFTFTVAGRVAAVGLGDPGVPVNAYTLETKTRPDALRAVTVKGELRGPAVAPYFDAAVLPFFRATFPPGAWVYDTTFEVNVQGDQATYSIEFTELREPLPVLQGVARVIDGEVTTSEERDEQMRLLRTVSYDLLVEGDPAKVRDLIRQGLDGTPLRERFEQSRYKELRCRGEFVLLLGGNGNRLLNWERQLTATTFNTGELDVHPVPGGAPQFVRRAVGAFTYVDSGSATGLYRFPKPPAFFKGITFFAASPEVTFDHVNAAEKRTSWKYTYLVDTELELTAQDLLALGRPDDPEFYLFEGDQGVGA